MSSLEDFTSSLRDNEDECELPGDWNVDLPFPQNWDHNFKWDLVQRHHYIDAARDQTLVDQEMVVMQLVVSSGQIAAEMYDSE
jgi:hypothetical protein